MKKLLTTLTILTATVLTTFAQSNFSKGNNFVEGTMNYSKNSSMASWKMYWSATQKSINLSAGKFITNKIAVGLSGSMSDSSISAGVFGRQNFYENKKFVAYGQLTARTEVRDDETKINNVNLGIGANYFISNRVALTTSLFNLVDYSVKSKDGKVLPNGRQIKSSFEGVDNPLNAAKFGLLIKF